MKAAIQKKRQEEGGEIKGESKKIQRFQQPQMLLKDQKLLFYITLRICPWEHQAFLYTNKETKDSKLLD